MGNNYNNLVSLNRILNNIKFKKQYIKKLKKKVFFLNDIKEKNNKILSLRIVNKKSLYLCAGVSLIRPAPSESPRS